jgi:phosphoesterase RecJ-like protein
MDLGETLLPALADEFGGDGGGHADAGVATLETATREDVEAYLVAEIESAFGITFGEI